MTTFSINIDARQLVYKYFSIPGKTGWLDSSTVQKLNLEPGVYSFQFASGYSADFRFSVTPQGTLSLENSRWNAFLKVSEDGSTLIIEGFTVTLDARYISGSGVSLVMPYADWITYTTCQMVPASFYSVQQGSGEVTNFNFKLQLDGTFLYDASYDIGNGGFLAGNNTSTLEFLGYPLLVDARAAGGAGLTIQPIWGMPFNATAVQFANLLPAQSFILQVNSGERTKAVFSLEADGRFSFDNSLISYLELQTFHGLTLLKVKAPLLF